MFFGLLDIFVDYNLGGVYYFLLLLFLLLSSLLHRDKLRRRKVCCDCDVLKLFYLTRLLELILHD